MGLVNQIRDTRVATVELFHARTGKQPRLIAGRLAIGTSGTSTDEVQAQRSHETVNDAIKFMRQLRWVEIRTVAAPRHAQ
jgi:hypothetical protein